MSQKEAIEWIRGTWNERKQGDGYTFAITIKGDGRYIGNIRLKILNTISRRADISLGIFIPTFRDKGLGTEALELIIDFAFKTLNLISLELRVFSNNDRAIAVYKKLGFQEIGLRRKADFIDGEFLDDLMMDLLVEEWENRIEA
jgi:RimJ/RimL family protein N-acetyltransferase